MVLVIGALQIVPWAKVLWILKQTQLILLVIQEQTLQLLPVQLIEQHQMLHHNLILIQISIQAVQILTTLPTLLPAEVGSTVELFNGTVSLGTTAADGSGDWSITDSTLGEGALDIKANATDTAGNTGANSAALTGTIDRTAPTAPTITSR